jgi:hypothetical protein
VETTNQQFDINQWLAAEYPNSTTDSISQITVAGRTGYRVTFKDEIGAGQPIVIIPSNGRLYQLTYRSNYDTGSPEENKGSSAFAIILQSLRFIP